MEFFETVKERYSYRGQYLEQPVSREDLRIIMQAGLDAPSGCNMQTTSLIGVDDPEIMKALSDILGKSNFGTAPAAICVLTEELPGIGGRLYNVQDYAAAIQNMLLAITALGYASCWVEGLITGEGLFGEKMAKLLGAPESARLVAFIPVGLPAQPPRRVRKKAFEERAWFNGYRA